MDANYQTTSPGIYAIGDCAGRQLLAHEAMAEAIACVEKIAGHHPKGVNYGAIPGCTYCEPEIASIGKTEAQARADGIDISVGKFPFIANGKAVGAGYTDGFVKVITNKARGEIVGVHAIGHGVTDLIAEMSAGHDHRGHRPRHPGQRPPPPDAVRSDVRGHRGGAGRSGPHLTGV